MTLVEAYIIFNEDMSNDPTSELQNKKLDRLNAWANTNGVKTIQELKVRLSNVGRHNLAVAAANHYAKIVQAIMDMSAEYYETFCQDPMSNRHMITSTVCPTEQRCEISMETDLYQYDAYLAHHSDDEEVVDKVRGELKSSGVRCSETALAGTSKVNSDNDPVKTAKRTVPFFSKNSLESKLFKMTCDVALIEADERKEDVMIPVTIDVDPKSLPPPYGTLNCIPYQSQDFIPKLVNAIKGPTDAPLYGELRDENENLKREIAALRQQLEDCTALIRRLQAE
ncbi:uncharacterized protein LOC106171217 [Lingula anatina]|uniref:Uncharacterized protein LOC106171217 n=1 Tax=Lingula anatina TaxID=7574 RepID=A0A1S3J9B4_LINAN|nr:uncharacterized protein LOC106171217 [Lingula anatina]|eukprot:XP_013406903.1 uncharacterized protein LOC106171217 [Lingula anatina]